MDAEKFCNSANETTHAVVVHPGDNDDKTDGESDCKNGGRNNNRRIGVGGMLDSWCRDRGDWRVSDAFWMLGAVD